MLEEATGRQGPLSYKRIDKSEIVGLDESIPFKKPRSYGANQKGKIIQNSDKTKIWKKDDLQTNSSPYNLPPSGSPSSSSPPPSNLLPSGPLSSNLPLLHFAS